MLELLLLIGAVVLGYAVARWWILIVAVVPALLAGDGNADSGPKWMLALFFAGPVIAAALAAGVMLRRQRSPGR